jgi:TPR repeat protein
VDFLEEIGNAQLVVAKSYAAEENPPEAVTWLDHAERTFTQLASTSHLAAMWVARGDLARTLGEEHQAADYYRQAAESLQDFHF